MRKLSHSVLIVTLPMALCVACKEDKTPPADVESLIEITMSNMVFVEGGSFMMGNIGYEVPEDDPNGTWVTMEDGRKSYRIPFPGCSNSCYPIHKVTLSSYYINKFETTIGEYDLYTQANELPLVHEGQRGINDNFLPDRAVYLGVDWNGANAYCQWLGEITGLPFNLPTEAQWEYAARSRGQAVRFATDNGEWDFGRNALDRTSGRFNDIEAVGSYPPNPLGIYDMTGNANEWVRDWYYPKAYKEGDRVDPAGPADGDLWNTAKLSRGFSRQHSDWNGRVVFSRIPKDIDYTAGNGFRCSIDSPLSMKELQQKLEQLSETQVN